MPDTQTHRILYTGTAPFAGWVAQTLREEGLDVSWTPVEERGTASDVVENVTVALIVTGTTAAVDAAIAKARELVLGHGTIEIEDDQDDKNDQKM